MDFEAKDFLKWTNVSRFLAGGEASITRDRIPKVHRRRLKKLFMYVEIWMAECEEEYISKKKGKKCLKKDIIDL